MNRDNVLFTTIGLLLGFIGGYLLHEEMAARQPPRRLAAAGPEVAATGPSPRAGGGPMEQVQQLRAYVEENPDDEAAVLLLANLNYDINNWSRAVELYERYLELAPDQVDVMTDLGISYRASGQLDKALGLFRKVQELDPQHWQARFNEVIVLAFDLGDAEAARAAMRKLQELQPANVEVERLAQEVERRLRGA